MAIADVDEEELENILLPGLNKTHNRPGKIFLQNIKACNVSMEHPVVASKK